MTTETLLRAAAIDLIAERINYRPPPGPPTPPFGFHPSPLVDHARQRAADLLDEEIARRSRRMTNTGPEEVGCTNNPAAPRTVESLSFEEFADEFIKRVFDYPGSSLSIQARVDRAMEESRAQYHADEALIQAKVGSGKRARRRLKAKHGLPCWYGTKDFAGEHE